MVFSKYKKWTVLFLVLLFFLGFFFFYNTIEYLSEVPLISEEKPPIIITLNQASSAAHFVQILKQNKLINSPKKFLMFIRLKGLDQQLKAGIYQVKPGETAIELLYRVVAGNVLTDNFTIIAGTTQQDVAAHLMQAAYLNYNPNDWALIQGNYPNAEGLLLADTYQYTAGSSSKNLLEQAHHHLVTYLHNSWTQRAANLPYKNSYELLTAASIIEKESAIPEERKVIAGILVNRLNKKMPLQMDPTVIYALGKEYKGKLLHNDLQVDSPYNSYRYRGLPPTPIATVSKEALDAASRPYFSNYLYFVARGDGTHQFSENYRQQIQAINQYVRKDS